MKHTPAGTLQGDNAGQLAGGDLTSYEELITRVRDRADTEANETAENAARAVVGVVTAQLPRREADDLAAALPPRLRDAARDTDPETAATDAANLVDGVAARLQQDRDRARYLLQAVLSALGDDQPDLMERVARSLPGSLGELSGAPVANAEPISSRRLTDDEVAQELRPLTGWTGDSRRIRRTVVAPREWQGRLTEQVRHHPRRPLHLELIVRPAGQLAHRAKLGSARIGFSSTGLGRSHVRWPFRSPRQDPVCSSSSAPGCPAPARHRRGGSSTPPR